MGEHVTEIRLVNDEIMIMAEDMFSGTEVATKIAGLNAEVLRELTPADIAIAKITPVDSVTPEIKKLRTSHHKLARHLSEGISEAKCAMLTGYSASRISILKNDPAFADLLTHYADRENEIHFDRRERVADLAVDAVEELHERLIEDPDSFRTRELLDIANSMNDRSGVGTSSELNVTLGADMQTIEALKKAAKESQHGTVKSVSRISQSSDEPALGDIIEGHAETCSGETEKDCDPT